MQRKVLIVDDLLENLALMKFILERDGWVVVATDDANDVVDTIREENPSVLIMDVNMPHVDGLEACRRVKETPDTAYIPVIIYTAYPRAAIREKAIELGAKEFLMKPFLPEDLRQQVRRAYESLN